MFSVFQLKEDVALAEHRVSGHVTDCAYLGELRLHAGHPQTLTLIAPGDWQPTAEIPLANQRLVLGRSSVADLTVDDQWVSRCHCEIIGVDDVLLVRDLESKNGTFVNGQQVEHKFLCDGDVLSVGTSQFAVTYE